MDTLEIIVGSESIHKLSAVRFACDNFKISANIIGTKTESGQNAQPIGFEETFNGAATRARQALASVVGEQWVALGIESGIMGIEPGTTIDIAVIVLLKKDGVYTVTTSQGIMFPVQFVMTALGRGFDRTTVGSVVSEKLGGDGTDPHSILTQGRLSRTITLTRAIEAAFMQLKI